uniref:Transcription factor CBF/NF-Y/archaeal histone domain-containing protein n=1 Tax=Clastoptera arizonana TaxID=38151 RepID=A0A1B6C1F2_9HEMI
MMELEIMDEFEEGTELINPVEPEVELPEDGEQTNEKVERLSKLPLARIKSIMKTDPDVNLASQEAVFLISKATELFIKSIANESFVFTTQAKKKTVQKRDVESAISAIDAFAFLEGALDT